MKWRRELEQGLAVFIALTALVGAFHVAQSASTWLRLATMFTLYFYMLGTAFFLWRGQRSGYEMASVFYWAQVPCTMAMGAMMYDFDGGLKIGAGLLNGLILQGAVFKTNLYIGEFESPADYGYGFVINFFALGLALYFTWILREPSKPQS